MMMWGGDDPGDDQVSGRSPGERAVSTAGAITRHGITLPTEQITEFCRRWKIRELAVFGSFLRDDFEERSDIDLLIDPLNGVTWSVTDILAMQQEMANLTGPKSRAGRTTVGGEEPELHPQAAHSVHGAADLCGKMTPSSWRCCRLRAKSPDGEKGTGKKGTGKKGHHRYRPKQAGNSLSAALMLPC
jgi:predicted nucleotidyltransferase